jgi:hypothetical protein
VHGVLAAVRRMQGIEGVGADSAAVARRAVGAPKVQRGGRRVQAGSDDGGDSGGNGGGPRPRARAARGVPTCARKWDLGVAMVEASVPMDWLTMFGVGAV